jgi:hypothetical protein
MTLNESKVLRSVKEILTLQQFFKIHNKINRP